MYCGAEKKNPQLGQKYIRYRLLYRNILSVLVVYVMMLWGQYVNGTPEVQRKWRINNRKVYFEGHFSCYRLR